MGIAHSSIVPNYGKPIYPVMGSKAPRMASNGCCAAFESSAQQRQQFPVSQYRVQSSRDFGTSEPVWIPSPHIITTNKHHSRNSYCACCHGRPNQNYVLCNAYIKSDALTIDHAT